MRGRAEGAGSGAASEALVTATVGRWSASLLRTARAHSLCDDDAQDAYQRALELFLTRAGRLAAETAHGWLHTVVKHEAMALRDRRMRLLGATAPDDADAGDLAAGGASPEDRAVAFEDLERAAEALQALKPQELHALWLQAHGLTYKEIEAATAWSYTKVNRCLTEGRRAFLARYRHLEGGEACAAYEDALAAIAAGARRPDEVAGLPAHLRRCGWCRATLRDRRLAEAPLAVLLPVAGLPLLGGGGGGGAGAGLPREAAAHAATRLYETIAAGLQERVAGAAVRAQAAAEVVVSGKAAAVAASAAALAGGGAVAVERAAPVPPRNAAVAGAGAPAGAAVTPAAPDPGPRYVPRDEVRPLPVVAEQRVRRVRRARAERARREFERAARREAAAREFAAAAAPRQPAGREFSGTGGSGDATAPAAGAVVAEFGGAGASGAPADGPATSAGTSSAGASSAEFGG